MNYVLKHMGSSMTLPDPADSQTAYDAAIAAALATLGPWVQGETRVEVFSVALPPEFPTPAETVNPAGPKPVSSFGGALHTDDDAKARIESTHAALTDAGIGDGNFRGQQFYDTGTRMASSGYAEQARRATEHASKQLVRDAIGQLVETVNAERRRDVTITASELAKTLHVNGSVRVLDGFKLNEPAMRGMLARLGSPASTYVFGLRARVAETIGAASEGVDATTLPLIIRDKDMLREVLRLELEQYGETELTLRVRDGLGDVFACVSPSYCPADAPAVLPSLLDALPSDARATFSYDPASTAWELRASVFTPTSVEEQAVGEPFEGYASFFSRDNGTASLRGGGGIILIRCLNASTYVVEDSVASRRHMGRIMLDLPAMVQQATHAATVLCNAWGVAREATLPRIEGAELEALTGYWRHLLTDRKSELVGVLAGRRETHTVALARQTVEQRRTVEGAPYNRADFAQGWTRYIQTRPTLERRTAETAIGAWLAHPAPMRVETL